MSLKMHNPESDCQTTRFGSKHGSDCTYDSLEGEKLAKHKERIRCILIYAMLTLIGLLCIVVILAFLLVPVIFGHSIGIQRLLLFTNFGLDTNPADFNFHERFPQLRLRNFYITFQDTYNQTISLGVWHLLPYALYPNYTDQTTTTTTSSYDHNGNKLSSTELLQNKLMRINRDRLEEIDIEATLGENLLDVLVYFHGSGETRKDPIFTYDVILNFLHVVAFDYRDFADSTRAVLTEQDIAQDAIHVINWVRERTTRRIYIWGHSLGTALSSFTVTKLPNELKPHGLILEAPFPCIMDAIAVHPYGKLFAWLPWFRQTIQDPLEQNGLALPTRKHILDIDCPILILHAKDDSIIPFELGQKLVQIAISQRTEMQGNITFVKFPAKYHYDHFRIYQSSKLPRILTNFQQFCDEFYNKTHPFDL